MTADAARLGSFLRARRAVRAPRDAGLPGGGNRRTPGLRREELAALAGVSVDYLTRLERGRHPDPSPEVLSALATALALEPDARRHLFALAGRNDPGTTRLARRDVPPVLARLVERAHPSPAWLLNRVKETLHWNAAAAVLLGDPGSLPAERRNYVDLVFSFDRWVDPGPVRNDVVAHLRQTTAEAPEAPAARSAVARLSAVLPDFAGTWARYDVRRACAPLRLVDHPLVGRLAFNAVLLDIEGGDLHLVVFEPCDQATAQRWADHLAALRTRRLHAV